MSYSKDPVAVAQAALQAGKEALDDYSYSQAPHLFTQPQLLAILVLKAFFKTDYRGITTLLHSLGDLRTAIGLTRVPHFSTLWHAEQRLLKKSPSIFFKLLPWEAPADYRKSA